MAPLQTHDDCQDTRPFTISTAQFKERSVSKEPRTRQDQSNPLPTPTTSGDDAPNASQQRSSSRLSPRLLVTSETPLDLYIPVGCLLIDRERMHESLCTSGNHEWIEMHHQQVPVLQEFNLSIAVEALLRSTWIRVTCSISVDSSRKEIWRVYVLPHDVSRGVVGREKANLRSALDSLLPLLNINRLMWQGHHSHNLLDISQTREITNTYFDLWADEEKESLFYLFNTLPSPNPTPQIIENYYLRKSVDKLLDVTSPVWGLKTELYPFQRRSAAIMIQKEVAPQMQLDPRFDQRMAPTGQHYYYCGRDRRFLRQPRYFDTVRGGILAESMGYGKTLICIAVILTTKGQIPNIPPQYVIASLQTRKTLGSLMDMAAAAMVRSQAPWGTELKRQDNEHTECIRTIERNLPYYEVLPDIIRTNRSSARPPPAQKICLFRGTLIVVPPNLVKQWRLELARHVTEGCLRILYMDTLKSELPSHAELATYDIILFSKNRFEKEARSSETGSIRTIVRNRLWKQTRSDDESEHYVSPLKGVHWLRIIIDEGHAFSNSSSDAATFAKTLLAERRWVVSGTPARDLLGVDAEVIGDGVEDVEVTRQKALRQRKEYNYDVEQQSGAVKAIGALASSFLHAQPWTDDRTAMWDEYVYRHEAVGKGKRTYTSFSGSLRRTLQSLVVKTQPEDVEKDMVLPPISHKVVKLEPCAYDKLTANLFILQFTANAVTSERVDVDYLFHRASRKHLVDLVKNLRLSAFTWSGFNEAHVKASLEVTEKYLAKEDTHCSKEDRKLLIDTASEAKTVLQLACWKDITEKALKGIHEMGVMLNHWPEGSQDVWTLKDCVDPMIMDIGRLINAQSFINGRLQLADPADGLAGIGVIANMETQATQEAPDPRRTINLDDKTVTLTSSGSMHVASPKALTRTAQPTAVSARRKSMQDYENNAGPSITQSSRKRKRRAVKDTHIELPADAPLALTQLIGTISTKFSYLISRILDLYKDHKCLIFYDGNHIAGFLGEAFELLHIKHLIYTGDIKVSQRSQYIELFNSDESQRVLLMDLKQAAHGLNITSATRIFFVNPVCRPNIEAQAIKRAHRIGQTQPVFVETLVLRGTVEEAMQDRASKMTAGQHLAAKTLEDDDEIKTILQEARVFHIKPEELVGHGCTAPLAVPQQVFGRPGRAPQRGTALEIELFGNANDEDGDDDIEQEPRRRKQPERKGKQRVAQDAVDDMGDDTGDDMGDDMRDVNHFTTSATAEHEAASERNDEGNLDAATIREEPAMEPSAREQSTQSKSTPSKSAAKGYTSIFGDLYGW